MQLLAEFCKICICEFRKQLTIKQSGVYRLDVIGGGGVAESGASLISNEQ